MRPTTRESSFISAPYLRLMAANCGSSGVLSVTGITFQSILSTAPVFFEMFRSICPNSRASAVILKIGAPPEADSSRVCS